MIPLVCDIKELKKLLHLYMNLTQWWVIEVVV
jgi:hypothetical protein